MRSPLSIGDWVLGGYNTDYWYNTWLEWRLEDRSDRFNKFICELLNNATRNVVWAVSLRRFEGDELLTNFMGLHSYKTCLTQGEKLVVNYYRVEGCLVSFAAVFRDVTQRSPERNVKSGSKCGLYHVCCGFARKETYFCIIFALYKFGLNPFFPAWSGSIYPRTSHGRYTAMP